MKRLINISIKFSQSVRYIECLLFKKSLGKWSNRSVYSFKDMKVEETVVSMIHRTVHTQMTQIICFFRVLLLRKSKVKYYTRPNCVSLSIPCREFSSWQLSALQCESNAKPTAAPVKSLYDCEV